MNTYPTLDLSNLAAGPDGPPISESQRIYFQERWRWRFFEFLLSRFEQEEANGLTQAKLARRIGRPPEVIHRWLGAPSNLTLDSVSDLLLGISAEEPAMGATSVLERAPTNHLHLDDDQPEIKLNSATTNSDSLRLNAA